MYIEDLPTRTTLTGEALVNSLFVEEAVPGEPIVMSNSKGERRRYLKQYTLKRFQNVPDGFYVVAKRFQDMGGGRYQRLEVPVKMTEELTVPRTCFEDFASARPTTYKLRSLISHHSMSGILSSGHYTCHVRAGENDDWYHINDGSVSLVGQTVPLSILTGAYVYYYERQGLDTEPYQSLLPQEAVASPILHKRLVPKISRDSEQFFAKRNEDAGDEEEEKDSIVDNNTLSVIRSLPKPSRVIRPRTIVSQAPLRKLVRSSQPDHARLGAVISEQQLCLQNFLGELRKLGAQDCTGGL
jgi:hypothetical protein